MSTEFCNTKCPLTSHLDLESFEWFGTPLGQNKFISEEEFEKQADAYTTTRRLSIVKVMDRNGRFTFNHLPHKRYSVV